MNVLSQNRPLLLNFNYRRNEPIECGRLIKMQSENNIMVSNRFNIEAILILPLNTNDYFRHY